MSAIRLETQLRMTPSQKGIYEMMEAGKWYKWAEIPYPQKKFPAMSIRALIRLPLIESKEVDLMEDHGWGANMYQHTLYRKKKQESP